MGERFLVHVLSDTEETKESVFSLLGLDLQVLIFCFLSLQGLEGYKRSWVFLLITLLVL